MGNHASPLPDNATPWHIEFARRLARRALLTVALAMCVALVAGFSYATVALSLRYFGPGGGSVSDQAIGCAAPSCAPGGPAATPIMPSFSSPASPPAHRATPKPTHTAAATRAPAPSPTHRSAHKPAPPPPKVTVSYASAQQWNGGFQGKLTIVNHGTATISTWEISIALPRDRVSSVWNAITHFDGDVLTLRPTTRDRPIPPRGEMSVDFIAEGPTTSPASCTYNGTPCA